MTNRCLYPLTRGTQLDEANMSCYVLIELTVKDACLSIPEGLRSTTPKVLIFYKE